MGAAELTDWPVNILPPATVKAVGGRKQLVSSWTGKRVHWVTVKWRTIPGFCQVRFDPLLGLSIFCAGQFIVMAMNCSDWAAVQWVCRVNSCLQQWQ